MTDPVGKIIDQVIDCQIPRLQLTVEPGSLIQRYSFPENESLQVASAGDVPFRKRLLLNSNPLSFKECHSAGNFGQLASVMSGRDIST